MDYLPAPSGVSIFEASQKIPYMQPAQLVWLSVSAFFIFVIMHPYLKTCRFYARPLLLLCLLLASTGQLTRSWIMELVVGLPLIDAFASSAPNTIMYAFCSIGLCCGIPIFERHLRKPVFYYSAGIFLAVSGMFLGALIGQWVSGYFVPFLPPLDTNTIIQPPYGMNVLIPAYTTFIEPVLACFIIFHFLKDTLKNVTFWAQVAALFVLISNGSLFHFLIIFYAEGNIFYRIFYYGQFVWEHLTLALLTVYGTRFINKKHKFSGLSLNPKIHAIS
jgi:hypothetical protein